MAVQLFNFQSNSPGYIQSGVSVTTSENSQVNTLNLKHYTGNSWYSKKICR